MEKLRRPVLWPRALLALMLIATTAFTARAQGQKRSGTTGIALSAINGSAGKADTLYPDSKIRADVAGFRLSGAERKAFEVSYSARDGQRIVVVFHPEKGQIGLVHAQVELLDQQQNVLQKLALTGLSSKGLEGENEPPLTAIFQALGYRIDLGWTTLANHTKPQLQGDEIAAQLFKKAQKGPVNILPVARYSPDFKLPFGYYTHHSDGPQKHPVGVLASAGKFPEHQTLFPRWEGNHSFDPGTATFGLYVAGPDHVAYCEDDWNRIQYPRHSAHATRIYPARDRSGELIAHTFFVCFEEAANGDYNDYVFMLQNVTPVSSRYTTLFNGRNFNGWHRYLEKTKRADPEHNFRIENQTIHVIGKQAGYLMTEKAYTNFHLKVDFKWGQQRWPPRAHTKRDAGVCYHVGLNEQDQVWPPSIECQIQEGDVGDFWLIGHSTLTVRGKTNEPKGYARLANRKGAEDAERPNGRWNTLEIISYKGTCVHVLNGELVNYGENASLQSGRILLQSEYSEIFYKDVQIRPL